MLAIAKVRIPVIHLEAFIIAYSGQQSSMIVLEKAYASTFVSS
jgi:hypothetical protein